MDGYGGYGGYGMGWFAPWGGFLMILFWIVVILLIAGVVRWLFGGVPGLGHSNQHKPEPSRRALEILEERYARGEIGREEFMQRRDDLANKG
jgi:putative membrane protein